MLANDRQVPTVVTTRTEHVAAPHVVVIAAAAARRVCVLVGKAVRAHAGMLDEDVRDVDLGDVVVDRADELLEVDRDVADTRAEQLDRVDVRDLPAQRRRQVRDVVLDVGARRARCADCARRVEVLRVFETREQVGKVGGRAADLSERACETMASMSERYRWATRETSTHLGAAWRPP